MTKQTKIILSVVISCILLLAIFIPSFAENGELTRYSLKSFWYLDETEGVYMYDNSATINTNNEEVVLSCNGYVYNVADEPIQFDTITFFTSLDPDTDAYATIISIHSVNDPNPESTIPLFISDTNTDKSIYIFGLPYFDLDVSFPSDEYITYLSLFFDFEGSPTPTPPYAYNPFLDIMNMVIEALDVPIFGTFSLWDMLTTLCGLFAVVWLLQLLAGG